MNIRKVIHVYISILLFAISNIQAQNLQDYQGTVCSDTPLLCNMGMLHMDVNSWLDLPAAYGQDDDSLKDLQPKTLCPGFNLGTVGNGQAHNTTWYCFIAEDSSIELDVYWNTNGSGIHAGIYEVCDFDVDPVACGATENVNFPAELVSNSLIVGKQYCLFVDGINVSSPRYRFDLKYPDPNTSQNFSLDPISQIIGSRDVCVGTKDYFEIDAGHNGYIYEWNLKLTTTSGTATIDSIVSNLKEVEFEFAEEGDYTVEVLSYTGCDTVSTTISVSAQYGPAEDFGQIEVCMDCLGTDLIAMDEDCITSGNLNIDPNGDAIIGWQSSTIIASGGIYSDTIETSTGCRYRQVVEVVEDVNISGIERDTFFCDLPTMITDSKGQERQFFNNQYFGLDINGAFTNRCAADFYYRVTTNPLEGNFLLECIGDKINLAYVLDGFGANTFNYTWYNHDTNTPLSSDDNKILDISLGTTYRVDIESVTGGCMESKIYVFTQDQLDQSQPNITSDTVYCSAQNEIKLFIEKMGEGISYIWDVLPTDNIEIENLSHTTDTIIIKSKTGNLSDFEFIVRVENGCAETKGTVHFLENPTLQCDNTIAEQLTFSWDVEDWMTGYHVMSPVSANYDLDSNQGSITFKNLSPDEMIEATISFENDMGCDLMATESCTTLNCTTQSVSITPQESAICYDKEMPLIPIDISNNTSGTWIEEYVENGFFNPNKLKQLGFDTIGRFPISFAFGTGTCDTVHTFVEVSQQPSFSLIGPEYDECPREGDLASLRILPQGIGLPKIFLDGEEQSSAQFYVIPGSYEVYTIDKNGCKSVVKKVEVTEVMPKEVDLTGAIQVKSFEVNNYTASLSSGFSSESISWTLDGSPICIGEDLLCSPNFNIENGTQELCVIANEGVCSDTSCLTLQIYTPIEIISPNAISTSGSSGNNEFVLTASVGNVAVNKFIVYDRYGNKIQVKENFTLDKGTMTSVWDGRYQGNEIVPGVYVYIMEYMDGSGEIHHTAGDITVLR